MNDRLAKKQVVRPTTKNQCCFCESVTYRKLGLVPVCIMCCDEVLEELKNDLINEAQTEVITQ
jgi:hypothetical protein